MSSTPHQHAQRKAGTYHLITFYKYFKDYFRMERWHGKTICSRDLMTRDFSVRKSIWACCSTYIKPPVWVSWIQSLWQQRENLLVNRAFSVACQFVRLHSGMECLPKHPHAYRHFHPAESRYCIKNDPLFSLSPFLSLLPRDQNQNQVNTRSVTKPPFPIPSLGPTPQRAIFCRWITAHRPPIKPCNLS